MKKRLLSTLLALCMALTLLPGTARAAEYASGKCGDNVTWEYSDGTLTIQGTGAMDNYDYMIVNATPWHDYQIHTIIISHGVTRIGDGAFVRCTDLTSVTIPDSVTSIGGTAFYGCLSLTSVAIPDSVTSIGGGAFVNCRSLTSVTIPNSVTSISDTAFGGCSSLTSVNIPNSVTSIGDHAFESCQSLISVTIPESVTTIGFAAFWDCDSLASVTIPNGVSGIEALTFAGCHNLTSMTISDSIVSIGGGAFGYCGSLTDVYYSGNESQWKQIEIDSDHYFAAGLNYDNTPIFATTIHYNNTELSGETNTPIPDSTSEHIYDTTDPGASVTLDAERLNSVTDSASAASAVQAQTQRMTTEQKTSPTGADLATLYAETAVSKAASKAVSGADILINKAAVAELEAIAKQTSAAVESALVSGGVSTARYISNIVTLSTEETGEISIRIDPDILTTEVDKVVVETPTYAITLKVADFKEDLTKVLTITAQDVGSGFAPGSSNAKATVKVNLPNGKTSNSVTLSLPKASGDTTYQTVVNTSGTATSSKYNPATTAIDGKVNTSGSYTVQTNQADFTDISNKSAEMQTAIRYLAARGIIGGTGGTNYSPDESITRAQIAALVIRALGKVDEGAKPTFKDVTTNNWYYSTAAVSQKAGIINGYEDNTYKGDNQILKEQIVAVAARVLKNEMGYKEPSNMSSYLSKYSDSVAGWAQPEVALATRENIVVYRTDGTFSGSKGMTRGDAAIIIYRLFQRIW